jgi:hypothetical protein
MPKTPMVKLCGLWANKSHGGEKYYSGFLGGVKVLMFRSKSDHPNAPTYNIFIAEKPQDEGGYRKKRRGDDDDDEPRGGNRSARDEEDDLDDEQSKAKKDEDDDDIPF